jgi:hypothetical protein
MHLYSCRVRLHGSLLHVVNKEHVTAAEIRILDHIHQGDNPAVYDIQFERELNRTDRFERDRLAATYSEMFEGGEKLVNRVLGVPGVPLPQKLEDNDPRLVVSNGILAARRAEQADEQFKRSKALSEQEQLDLDALIAAQDKAVEAEASLDVLDTPEAPAEAPRRYRRASEAAAG